MIADVTDRTRAAYKVVQEARNICEQNPNDHEAFAALRAAWAAMHDAEHAAAKEADYSKSYPPGFWPAYERFRQGHTDELEAMMEFLEADTWAFRSGYAKTKIIRSLKPEMLTPSDAARLQRVVLHVVDTRDDRDFRA